VTGLVDTLRSTVGDRVADATSPAEQAHWLGWARFLATDATKPVSDLGELPRPLAYQPQITPTYETPAWVDPDRDPHRLARVRDLRDRIDFLDWHVDRIRTETGCTREILAARQTVPACLRLTATERDRLLIAARARIAHHRSVINALQTTRS
jgi:hypothetical protein